MKIGKMRAFIVLTTILILVAIAETRPKDHSVHKKLGKFNYFPIGSQVQLLSIIFEKNQFFNSIQSKNQKKRNALAACFLISM